MAGQARLTQKQVEYALQQAAGNVTYAAKSLGVTRGTLYNHIKKSATLQAVLTDTREELVDIAESALKREVLEGNITAIIFTLKTLGKSRGYVERQEVSGPEGSAITLTWADTVMDDHETGD